MRRHVVGGELDERLSRADLVARRDARQEALAAERDRVEADVEDELDAV